MELSRQEYRNELPFPSPGIFPTQVSNPNLGLSHCRLILYHLSHQGSPQHSEPPFKSNNSTGIHHGHSAKLPVKQEVFFFFLGQKGKIPFGSAPPTPIFSASLVAQTVKTACNAGDPGLIPGSGRSLEKGMATYSLQSSHLENSMDREACRATVCGFAKSWTLLSD